MQPALRDEVDQFLWFSGGLMSYFQGIERMAEINFSKYSFSP